MQLVIRPLYSLTNRARIQSEMEEDSKIWRDALIAIVPIKMLKTCFERARDNTKSSFAPNYFDVKNEWLALESEIKNAEQKKLQTELDNDPVLRCSNKNLHQNDKGDVWRSFSLDQPDELVPCETCRFDDFLKWKRTQIALYGEHQPLTRLERYNSRPSYQNLKDPAEILNRAKDEINRQMVAAIGKPAYDDLFSARKTVFNALKWVWEKDGK
ncbi:MAG TPA: hypothetical protein VF692_07625 [Pyrinomonadaceae bacterium]